MSLLRHTTALLPQCGTCNPTWGRSAFVAPLTTAAAVITARRGFSSSSISSKPVDLASDVYSPKTAPDEPKGPLLVLHGLYGSKQNWRSQAKGMAQHLGRDVITLDLRNHGLSPHAPDAAYSDLAGDVRKFIDDRKLRNICLVGHSMRVKHAQSCGIFWHPGGKVAMALTLEPHEQIKQLVVVDIAPGIGAISPEFKAYLAAMKEINDANVMSRKEADAILSKAEPVRSFLDWILRKSSDLGVRQFLLTNLIRSSDSTPYTFRLPLDYLSNQIDQIGSFPFPPGTKEWNGPALFLKGGKSKYINRRNIPLCEGYFPKMELKTLETGHWALYPEALMNMLSWLPVHAEKPKEFLEALQEFLDKNS
ncbi:BQ2448_7562 [Microbotryum intermedium]|uniref:BQ2448_7562 protein n=1 Tax=Microbotryum intermedium TaxID=269621 RepID=A0A238FRD3_9BASI|nr:BQ2448_7562 [Microbotryum intermedium]